MAFGISQTDKHDPEDSTAEPYIEVSRLAGKDGGEEGRRLTAFWRGHIEQADMETDSWMERGRGIERRYRDERNQIDEQGQRRTNNLWANVQITMPAIYGRCPLPIVERKFKDKDPIGRFASQIIERSLRNEIEINGYHEAVTQAVLDYLLPGRGCVWVRYEPEFGKSVSIPLSTKTDLRDAGGAIFGKADDERAGNASDINTEQRSLGFEAPEDDGPAARPSEKKAEEQNKLDDTSLKLVLETAPVDYVNWTDLYLLPAGCRVWSEVRAVAKKVYFSRDQNIGRFGREIGNDIPLQKEDREKRNQAETSMSRVTQESKDAKAEIWEIWDKDTMCVYWIAEGYEFLCDMKPDPLGLSGFFPIPKPLFANSTNNTIIPVPDYSQYQDQAIQIDELTQRISMLSKVCKIAGTYNAACEALARLLDESVENKLIDVDNWIAFAEKGGVPGQVSFLPIKDAVEALVALYQVKDKLQAEMDRITGLTDILRGVQSDGRVTLGGQKLQGSNGRTRLQYRQNEVGRFCRDVVRLVAEVMCKHFSQASLVEASGALYEEGLGVPDVMSLGFSGGRDALDTPPPPIQGEGGTVPRPGAQPPSPSGKMIPQAPKMLPGPTPMGGPPGGNAGPPGKMPIQQPMPPAGGMMVPQPPVPQLPGQPGQGCMGPFCDEQALQDALARISAAINLLRNDYKRGFRIEIDVDSNILGDQQEEKQEVVEFLQGFSAFMKDAGPMAAQNPLIAPLLGKILLASVRRFRFGRELESEIEDYIEQQEQALKEPKGNGPPPPEQIKAQAIMVKGQVDLQKSKLELAKLEKEGHGDDAKSQAEVAAAAAKAQAEKANADSEMARKQIDLEMAKIELEMKRLDLENKRIEVGHAHKERQTDIAERHLDRIGNAHEKAANAFHLQTKPPNGRPERIG